MPFAAAMMAIMHIRATQLAAVFTSNLCNLRVGKHICNKSADPKAYSAEGPPEFGSAG